MSDNAVRSILLQAYHGAARSGFRRQFAVGRPATVAHGKLNSRPRRSPLMRRQVRAWASCAGRRFATALISMITCRSTRMSARKPSSNGGAFVGSRNSSLPLEGDFRLLQLVAEAAFINRLQHARTRQPMHLNGKPDDAFGQFARKQHPDLPPCCSVVLRGLRVKCLIFKKRCNPGSQPQVRPLPNFSVRADFSVGVSTVASIQRTACKINDAEHWYYLRQRGKHVPSAIQEEL